MPNTEPPADFYLSKSKKFSSPKKRFWVSLDVQFTQYTTMTKQHIMKKAAMETYIWGEKTLTKLTSAYLKHIHDRVSSNNHMFL